MAPIKSNNPFASYFDFFSRTGTDAVSSAPLPEGITATGGIIGDYEVSGTYYRAHIFTSSGAFAVTDLGNISSTVEYLVVAGGGGGGSGTGAGGGAGGYRSSVSGESTGGGGTLESVLPVSTSPGSYTVTIGGGGLGAHGPQGVPSAIGSVGANSVFGPITSTGGGGGGTNNLDGTSGGSGGGGGHNPGSGGSGTTNQGYAGGDGGNAPKYGGGGGGGAGGAGGPGGGSGGNGLPSSVTGTNVTRAGGGGGGVYNTTDPGGSGGSGGGGSGGNNSDNGGHATFSTGSGGGGQGNNKTGGGGNGAGGIVVVRYQIGSQQSGTAKATGGSISYYGGKTIHAFTSSGNFVAPATFNETVEYVVVGGGGAGGGPSAPSVNSYYGGGGGAGAYRKGSTPISTPQTIAIQVGAGGAKGALLPAGGSPSYFGSPITSPGGGYGATWQDPGGQPTVGGGPGASSGGSSYGGSVQPAPGDPFSPTDATANTPTNGWGHPGGTGAPQGNSGGGGGAGGSGQNADASNGGDGGAGMQLPTTFRDPAQSFGAPGPTNTSLHNPGWTNLDNSGKYWVAGGGGGSSYGPNDAYTPGGGGTNTHGPGSYAGAGQGSRFFANGTAALQNTGSGGGGMERMGPGPSPQPDAGNGGSGLVLIAYPT